MNYGVSIPITGVVYVEIEAENEEEALEKAWQREVLTDDITDWDMHENIVTGNVFHGMLNSVDVEELE